MSAVIRVESLNKTFGRKQALFDLALSVESGEMVALIGASGSGKSTLLRHVAGLACCDRSGGGSIQVLGREVQAAGRLNGEVRRLRADIGYIFQQFNLVGRLSVLQNVLLGCLGRMPRWRGTLGLFNAEEKQRALQALARVGLADLAQQRAVRRPAAACGHCSRPVSARQGNPGRRADCLAGPRVSAQGHADSCRHQP